MFVSFVLVVILTHILIVFFLCFLVYLLCSFVLFCCCLSFFLFFSFVSLFWFLLTEVHTHIRTYATSLYKMDLQGGAYATSPDKMDFVMCIFPPLFFVSISVAAKPQLFQRNGDTTSQLFITQGKIELTVLFLCLHAWDFLSLYSSVSLIQLRFSATNTYSMCYPLVLLVGRRPTCLQVLLKVIP